jgi:hypothetical protein
MAIKPHLGPPSLLFLDHEQALEAGTSRLIGSLEVRKGRLLNHNMGTGFSEQTMPTSPELGASPNTLDQSKR